MCKQDSSLLRTESSFYKQVLAFWCELYSKAPNGAEETWNKILWNNRHITVDGKPIFEKKLYDTGIVQLKDLLSSNGKLLEYNMLQEKYKLDIRFMDYCSLASAIPKTWLKRLVGRELSTLSDIKELLRQRISKMNSKIVYWRILNEIAKPPTASIFTGLIFHAANIYYSVYKNAMLSI